MSAQQLFRWEEYASLEPFGQPWENWLMARQAWDFACVHSKKGGNPPFQSYIYERKDLEVKRKDKEFVSFLKSKVKH